MREPLQSFQGDHYPRPNQTWLCGLSEEAAPCPLGPTARGRCPQATACQPLREGDRWRCNRSVYRGGLCEKGPSPDGECCLVYQCTPLRSLRSRRGRFVIGCALIAFGALCTLLSADWRNEALSPGPLATHHAQLLRRGDKTDRCAACHAAGNQSFLQWMQHATKDALSQPTQSDLCMECHAKQISQQWATAAHNVDPAELFTIDSAAGTTVDSLNSLFGKRRIDPHESLACAACHREHHGAEHDLAWMSDSACQACHRERYHSFATDHPDFGDWPMVRRTRIAFDHTAHQAKHFPKEKQEFACALCHGEDDSDDFQQTYAYVTTCAQCHDRDIAASWEAGMALFALPMLNVEALEDAQHNIGQWPEEASDEFDGALPTIMKLLLLADPRGKAALEILGVDFDFFDIDPDNPVQVQAAANAIQATKQLLYDITQQGHAVVRERVQPLVERELSTNELVALTAHLSPENLAMVRGRWLPQLVEEMSQAEENSEAESSATLPPPDVTENLERESTQNRLVGGGWFHDDVTLSIRYQPTGHDDPWPAAWIDVLAEASNGPQQALAEPLLRQMMQPTAAGQCGRCHSVDRDGDGKLMVHWQTKRSTDAKPRFTRFSHRPHLVQAQLADCNECHRIKTDANVMTSYAAHSPTDFEAGFEPLTRQSCAECHTSRAAGDSCLQCHRYHVGK